MTICFASGRAATKRRETPSKLQRNGAAGDNVVISRVDLSLDFNKQLNRQIYQVGRDATIKLSDLKTGFTLGGPAEGAKSNRCQNQL